MQQNAPECFCFALEYFITKQILASQVGIWPKVLLTRITSAERFLKRVCILRGCVPRHSWHDVLSSLPAQLGPKSDERGDTKHNRYFCWRCQISVAPQLMVRWHGIYSTESFNRDEGCQDGNETVEMRNNSCTNQKRT